MFLWIILTLGSCNPFGTDINDKPSQKNVSTKENIQNTSCEKTELMRVQGIPVYNLKDSKVIFFETGMSVDVNGSPHAFHPKNMGLDDLKHAGKPGNWFGIVTDNNEPSGIPVIQNDANPAPGYFISTTSLIDKAYNFKDPMRYINSEKIPYFVLPPEVMNAADVNVGDLGFIYNRTNNKMMFGIFADISPIDKIGAASIAMANALGINSDARIGGIENGIIYLVFQKSGNHKPKTIQEIYDLGAELFHEFGGMSRFKECFLH